MVSLREIHLKNAGLTEKLMRLIWEGIGNNKLISLKKVDLSGNQNITGKGRD
jgi:hypothetical protein